MITYFHKNEGDKNVSAYNLLISNKSSSYEELLLLPEPFNPMTLFEGIPGLSFLSLIKHLCQSPEPVLTEHAVLSPLELVLTTTSCHQVRACAGSESSARADCREAAANLSAEDRWNRRRGPQTQTTFTKKQSCICNYITSDVQPSCSSLPPPRIRVEKGSE